ncbi:MAG: hypothetical protein ACRDKA_03590 [Actinomycetota bacterium]
MDDPGALPARVEALIERALALDDEDRRRLANARGAIDETFHLGAWRSANEIIGRNPGPYIVGRQRIASAFIPQRLEELIRQGSEADPSEVELWKDVARLARAGLDDALLGLLAADTIPPPHLRELYGPWKAMLAAAHQRNTAARPS